MAGETTLEDTIRTLPPELRREVAAFVAFLLFKRTHDGERHAALDTELPDERPSVLDVIAAVPPGRGFQTAAEVQAYLRNERDSWEH